MCITHFSTFLWCPLHNYDVEPPSVTFYEGCNEHTSTKFPFSSGFNLRRNCRHLTNYAGPNNIGKVWKDTNSSLAMFSLPSSSSCTVILGLRWGGRFWPPTFFKEKGLFKYKVQAVSTSSTCCFTPYPGWVLLENIENTISKPLHFKKFLGEDAPRPPPPPPQQAGVSGMSFQEQPPTSLVEIALYCRYLSENYLPYGVHFFRIHGEILLS